MGKTNSTLSPATEKREKELKSILFLLENKVEEMADEIHRSNELYKIGERTPLIESIEKTLSEPTKTIFELSKDIEKIIYSIVNKAVTEFFTTKKILLENLYRITNTANPLTYAIILKEDNFLNRMEIFEFFEKYDLTDFSEKFPVIFHFVPTDIENEIPSKEAINLN